MANMPLSLYQPIWYYPTLVQSALFLSLASAFPIVVFFIILFIIYVIIIVLVEWIKLNNIKNSIDAQLLRKINYIRIEIDSLQNSAMFDFLGLQPVVSTLRRPLIVQVYHDHFPSWKTFFSYANQYFSYIVKFIPCALCLTYWRTSWILSSKSIASWLMWGLRVDKSKTPWGFVPYTIWNVD